MLGNTLSWAAVPVLLRDLTTSLDAWTANGLRYPLAAVLNWPILWLAWRSGKLYRRVFVVALVPAFMSFSGQVFWGMAPYYLEASSIGFLIKISIVWGAAGAMVFFPAERALLRSGWFRLGVLLTVCGFLALAFLGGALTTDVTRDGVLLILACSLFFGLYGVSIRHFMRGVPPFLAFAVVSQYVSVGVLTLMFFNTDVSAIAEFSQRTWIFVVASSLLGISISHVLYYVAIAHVGAALPTLMHFVTPFLTSLLAYLWLGESLGPWKWCAGLALLAGGVCLLRSQTVLRKPAL